MVAGRGRFGAQQEGSDMTRTFSLVLGGIAIVGVLAGASVRAGHMTPLAEPDYLTVNVPIALPGVALPPGTYIFELADPRGRVDLVRVSSLDRSQVYFMGFTQPVKRPTAQRTDRSLV